MYIQLVVCYIWLVRINNRLLEDIVLKIYNYYYSNIKIPLGIRMHGIYQFFSSPPTDAACMNKIFVICPAVY
jgi:hypothetical protein